MLDGIQPMVTFNWKSWAISKAIGIVATLAGADMANLAAKAGKTFKLGKPLPEMPKGVTKEGLSHSMKQVLKTVSEEFAEKVRDPEIMGLVHVLKSTSLDAFLAGS